MSAKPPIATGHFGKTPLLHVLVSVVDRGITGTLVVEDATGGKSAVYVRRGVPTKVRIAAPEARLGELLVQLGWVDSSLAERTYALAQDKGLLHGQVLMETGAIDADLLARALRTQVLKKLAYLGGLSGAVYGLYEDVDYLANWRGRDTPVHPLIVFGYLGRFHAPPAQVAQVLARVAERSLRFHAQADPMAFGFDRSEHAFVEAMRAKAQTLETLNRMGIVAPHRIERIVYVLAITRHLDLGAAAPPLGIGIPQAEIDTVLQPKESLRPSRPVVMAAQGHEGGQTLSPGKLKAPLVGSVIPKGDQEPADAHAVDPALLARRAEIETLAAKLDSLDHYALLGLEKQTPVNAVQAHFLQLARQFHPDRLPPGLADLRPLSTRIFARMTEAQQVLGDPEKRERYDRTLAGEKIDEEAEQVQRILRAASAFQKAEVLLKKRMLAAAELEAQRALQDDPEQADHLALVAWIRATRTEDSAELAECLRLLGDAVRRNPDSEKNRYYRLQLLRRLGRMEEAVVDCRYIVERNPHHVDALREIRLWERRRAQGRDTLGGGKKPPSKPDTARPQGFLDKLFKR